MFTRILSLCLAVFLALLIAVPPVHAETVTELDQNGKIKAKYATDDDGRRHGGFAAYFPNGKIKVRAAYKRGKLHGNYLDYHANGKIKTTVTYKNGKRDGKFSERDDRGRPTIETVYDKGKIDGLFEAFRDGELLSKSHWERGRIQDVDGLAPYTKSKDDIRDAVEDIFNQKDPLEAKADDPKAFERGESLRVLKVYRYICDVPWRDLVLDQKMNDHADAGSVLCETIGRLDHTPANPGMPEDEYKFAYKGTSSSNLYMGKEDRGMVHSVRGYMDDSDASNIDVVGHRRWCLNPPLMKTGFGSKGRFAAMWSMDSSRKKVPDYEHVSWPPPGYVPAYYFEPHYAWNVSLHRRKFKAPDASKLKISVYEVGSEFVRYGAPLPLNHMNVSGKSTGIPYCIIFRPEGIVVEAGRRYWVEIAGLEKDRQPYTLRYVVEFFDL